jgi:hypothetical protein
MPKLDKKLRLEVAQTVLDGGSVLFLTPNSEMTDRVADLFRKAFVENAMEVKGCAELTARKLMKPEGANPSYVQLAKGPGHAFFHPNQDMTADEEIGNPTFVYWPTEGGDYQKVPYNTWKRERRAHLWRPVHLKGQLLWEDTPAVVAGPLNAWAKILEDDL